MAAWPIGSAPFWRGDTEGRIEGMMSNPLVGGFHITWATGRLEPLSLLVEWGKSNKRRKT